MEECSGSPHTQQLSLCACMSAHPRETRMHIVLMRAHKTAGCGRSVCDALIYKGHLFHFLLDLFLSSLASYRSILLSHFGICISEGLSNSHYFSMALNPSRTKLMKRIWRQADAVCFDVDSTLIKEEGIDGLAEFCGAGTKVKDW